VSVAARPVDPEGLLVQTAEDEALPGGGRRFRRFAEVRAYVDHVVGDPWWSDTFPWAPVAVHLERRSRSATFSAAHVAVDGDAVVFLRDGSWDAVTVLHELAHVAARSGLGDRPPHGPEFTDALRSLWRRHLGIQAWAALDLALGADVQGRATRSPARQRDRRRSGTSR